MSLKTYRIAKPFNGYQFGELVDFNDDDAKQFGKRIEAVKVLKVDNKAVEETDVKKAKADKKSKKKAKKGKKADTVETEIGEIEAL
jgi:hypothetical protein